MTAGPQNSPGGSMQAAAPVQQLFPSFPQDPFTSDPPQGYYNYGYAYPGVAAAAATATSPSNPHAFIPDSVDPLSGVSSDPFQQQQQQQQPKQQDVGDVKGARSSMSTSAPRLNPATGRTASLDPPPTEETPPPSPSALHARGHRRNMSDTSAFNK